MEITEDALLISTGYADKSGKDMWIPVQRSAAGRTVLLG